MSSKRKKTTTKPKRATVAKTVAKAAPPPVISEMPAAASAATPAAPVAEDAGTVVLKKGDLLDRMVTKGDLKRNQAKAALEAALEVLGEALVAGEDLNLPPLGKVKVVRHKDADNADIYTLRVRRSKAMVAANATPKGNAE